MPKPRRVLIAIDLRYQLRHHHGVFAGAQQYAAEHADWDTVIQPFVRSAGAGSLTRYDGIIARATVGLARQAARARVPLVNIWSGSPVRTVPGVFPDFRTCGRLAAEHLVSRGLRQFAFHGFTRHRASALALEGIEEVLRENGLSHTSLAVSRRCDEDPRAWDAYARAVERWMAGWKPPLGVVVSQDILCRYLASACRHAGLRVPVDVTLIGMGNEPLVCMRPEPSLSSIDLNYERVGYEAAAMLDRLMAGAARPAAPILVEAGSLAVRQSTDAYAVDDPTVSAALHFVAERSHGPLRVEAVADHVHVTVRSLERRFRAVLGRTVVEEIARLRLERAKRTLVDSDVPIKNVAHQSGFRGVKHFHKVFRAAEGVTPGEYRRRRR